MNGAYLQVKGKNRQRKRKLVSMLNILGTVFFAAFTFCGKVLLLLLNELLLQLIITDLKCNFVLKFRKKKYDAHQMDLRDLLEWRLQLA